MTGSRNAWGELFDDPARHWEHEAERARHIARMATDRNVQRMMLEAAADYDRFASHARNGSSKGIWSTLARFWTRWWLRLIVG